MSAPTGVGPSLARSSDPTVLIPGDPDAVRADANRIDALAQELSWAAATVTGTSLGVWSGQCHDVFATVQQELCTRLSVAATSITTAASALHQYASVLERAQADARTLARQWRNGAACVPAEPGHLGVSLAPEQVRAQAAFDQLAADVGATANAAAAMVEAATIDAPIVPTFWNRVGLWTSGFGHGAWESVRDPIVMGWQVSAARALIDNDGWKQSFAALVGGLYTSLQDPRQFSKDLIDWDTWETDPARALGHLAPDVALAILTGGTAAAAIRGGRAGAEAGVRASLAGAARAATRNAWENSAIATARRAMTSSVSGFWDRRMAAALALGSDRGELDISGFFPNSRSPQTAAARISAAERLIRTFEGTDRHYLANMFDGQRFNYAREGVYDFHEVTIRQPDGTVKYLDDYTPGDAIVSRKATQLAEVSPARIRGIIDEFEGKYRADDLSFTIADTTANRAKFAESPELLGRPLDGQLVLEVPVQDAEVPAWVRQYAADHDVLIRDTAGIELNRTELDADEGMY